MKSLFLLGWAKPTRYASLAEGLVPVVWMAAMLNFIAQRCGGFLLDSPPLKPQSANSHEAR